jgi:hypothetical protein
MRTGERGVADRSLRAIRGELKCVPDTNRMAGPKLGAASTPVKKSPGTLDSKP